MVKKGWHWTSPVERNQLTTLAWFNGAKTIRKLTGKKEAFLIIFTIFNTYHSLVIKNITKICPWVDWSSYCKCMYTRDECNDGYPLAASSDYLDDYNNECWSTTFDLITVTVLLVSFVFLYNLCIYYVWSNIVIAALCNTLNLWIK